MWDRVALGLPSPHTPQSYGALGRLGAWGGAVKVNAVACSIFPRSPRSNPRETTCTPGDAAGWARGPDPRMEQPSLIFLLTSDRGRDGS